jgi:RNA polymerase sigma-70 factor (ECF subfamily)
MTPLLAQRPRAERAFERIYRRHVTDVYRYCLVVLRNRSDAEDVTQTTFMNAYRAFQRGERPRDAHRWLIAIAHNVCRQRFRQAQRRVEEVAYDDGIGEALVPEEDGPSAEDLRRALDQLAFNQRAALVMRELEGRSYAEIAEILELSVSAVETLLFRARRALREQLECSLTCQAAELAISRQLDGRLGRSERGQLRAHLRRCKPCATLARKQRAQRAAIKALGAVPLPASLASFFGGGSAAAGGALAGAAAGGAALKVAAVVAAAGVVTAGASYELSREPIRDAVSGAAKAAPHTRPAAVRARDAATATPRSSRAPDERPPVRSRSTDPGRAAVAPPAASATPKDPAASRRGERPAKPAKGRDGGPAAVPARSGKPARTAKPARARPARAAATPLTRAARPQQPVRSTPARPAKTTPAKTMPAKATAAKAQAAKAQAAKPRPARPKAGQARPKPTPPARPPRSDPPRALRPDDRARPRPVVPPGEPPPGEEEGADPAG